MSLTSKRGAKAKGSAAVSESSTYQKVVTFGNQTLHRSFSYDHQQDGSGASLTRVTVSDFIYPTSNKTSASKKRKQLTSSSGAGDESSRKKAKSSKAKMEGLELKMGQMFKILVWVTAIGSSIFIYHMRPFNYYQNIVWPVDQIETELETSLFGQDSAINQLAVAIEWVFMSETPTVIILTGNVGVGKTTAANVIMKTFPWKEKATLVSADDFSSDTSNLMSIVREPAWNLLVIEHCCHESRKVMRDVATLLNRAKSQEAKLMIFVIFTHQNDIELNSFLDLFQMSELAHYHIRFQPANREMIRKCLLREVAKVDLPIVDDVIEQFVEEQMKVKEIGGAPGCKQMEKVVNQYRAEVIRVL